MQVKTLLTVLLYELFMLPKGLKKKKYFARFSFFTGRVKTSANVKHSDSSCASGDKTDFSVEIFTSLEIKE